MFVILSLANLGLDIATTRLILRIIRNKGTPEVHPRKTNKDRKKNHHNKGKIWEQTNVVWWFYCIWTHRCYKQQQLEDNQLDNFQLLSLDSFTRKVEENETNLFSHNLASLLTRTSSIFLMAFKVFWTFLSYLSGLFLLHRT